jgi:hypothetical protein
MDEVIITSEAPRRENFFLGRMRKYQVLTFTLGFLFLFRFVGTLIFYFAGQSTFIEQFGLSIGFFLIAIPVAYLAQWLVATWVASKYTREKLKEKFYRHPIATMIFAFLYVTDLPYRLSESDLGGGLFKMINAFEIIIYYAFLSFLWWLLICWISEKIWKKQRFMWEWYKKVVDKIFVFLPPLYKFILGLMVALLIFLLLFVLMAGVFNYSGEDLQKF